MTEPAIIHPEPSPLAGTTVPLTLNGIVFEYRIEDWVDRLGIGSWMFARRNIACLNYGMRSGFAGLPCDNEVLYGKIGNLGYLIHLSEVEEGRIFGDRLF